VRIGQSSSSGGKREGAVDSPSEEKDGSSDAGQRVFVSYVATHPNAEEHDPDGLDQQARLRLEENAIGLILSLEPELQRTPQIIRASTL